MNQLSSRDFFLVEFNADLYDRSLAEPTEMIFAIGGVQLKEAVQGILERRNLLADRIHIFLESSKTPLPWETDTSFLGGHRLYIRAKESDSPFSRAQFPTGNLLPDAISNSLPKAKKSQKEKDVKTDKKATIPPIRKKTLPEATLSLPPDPMEIPTITQIPPADANCNSKKTLRPQGRLSQIFPNSLFKPEICRLEVHERLSSYQTDVHPDFDLQLLPANRSMATAFSDFKLESHWSHIITNRDGLSKRQAEQQEAIWELIETEFAYIHKLQLMAEYYGYLLRLQTETFLTEIDPELIFGNILEVYAANLYFWQIGIQPVLDHSRTTGDPLDPILLDAGFQEISRIFQVYIRYTLTHADMAQYVSKKQKESETFREFVAWTQNQKCSSRLQLTDLLVKPMQRLTKYPLLLKAVLKNSGDLPTKAALACMIRNVEDFLSRINVELRYKQQLDALQHITSMIDGYDVIDTTSEELNRVLRQHSSLDLTIPMLGCHPKVLRILFLQGDLKLRDAYCKMDTHCFLFTDMFLVGKQMPRKGDRPRIKIVKQPFHIDRILIQELREQHGFAFIYLNEFGVASTAFTLQANNVIEGQKWLDFFRIAKESYQQYKDHPNDFSWLPHPIPFDSQSLSNGLGANNSLSKGSQKLSTTLTPGSNGSFLTVEKSSPLRRISIGAMESARRKLTEIPSLNHLRSSSMDSNALGLNNSQTELSSTELSCMVDSPIEPVEEVIKSPNRRRKAASLSPSPIPPAFGSNLNLNLAPTGSSGDLLMRQNSSGANLHSYPQHGGSSETLINDDLAKLSLSSLSPPLPLSSPLYHFHLEGDVEPAVMQSESLLDLYSSQTAAIDAVNYSRVVDDVDNNNISTCKPPVTKVTTKLLGNSGNRRLERRYHTADAIETRKGAEKSMANSIRKRFSWNNFASKSKSADESALVTNLNSVSGANNHLSSDSFCSSSGVSSSSSQLCVSPTTTDPQGHFNYANFYGPSYSHGHCLLLETKSDATLKYDQNLPEPPKHPPPPLFTLCGSAEGSNSPHRHISTVAIGDFELDDVDVDNIDDVDLLSNRKISDPIGFIPTITTHTATPEQTPISIKSPWRFALNDTELDSDDHQICQKPADNHKVVSSTIDNHNVVNNIHADDHNVVNNPITTDTHKVVNNIHADEHKIVNTYSDDHNVVNNSHADDHKVVNNRQISKDSLIKLILENHLEVSEV